VRADPAAARGLLPRTWYAFFGRFGGVLRPIQAAALADLAAGRDAVLVAPTASGKTEAAAAPLFERLLADGPPPRPGLVLVSPTRALANDLARRLLAPCEPLRLEVAVRTGDRPSALRRRRPPHGVVTTPESLDSVLARWPGLLRPVRALVLDELHLLLESGRGDQLAVLTRRLRRVAEARLQVVVLSATLPDAAGVAGRFLREATVHRVPGTRALELEPLVPGEEETLAAPLSEAVRRLDLRKVLAFVDRRADAETVAAELRGRTPFGDAVLVHHGSLQRQAREWAEGQLLTRPRALCVATGTLEVGIDVGDVDAVLLLTPPASVSSLLQRVGRGNRRTGACRVLAACPGPGAARWTDSLVRLAREGDLCEDRVPFRPGVLPQQALSLAFQNRAGWVSAPVLAARLPPDAAAEYDEEDLEGVLAALVEHGWLQPLRGGRHAPGDRAEAAFRRGRLHGVIDGASDELEVVDELTGERLGHVARGGAGGHLALRGRDWRVVGQGEDVLRVRGGGRAGGAPGFSYRGRASCSRRLCEAFRESLGLPPGRLLLLPAPGGGLEVFHFLGTAASELLAGAVVRSTGDKTRRPGALAFTWAGEDPAKLKLPGPADLAAAAEGRAVALARRLGSGPYTRLLPRELAERFVRAALAPEALAGAVGGEPVTEVEPETEEVLRELRGR